MSESKFTPGPWKVGGYSCEIHILREWDDKVMPGESETFGSAAGANIATIQYCGDGCVPTNRKAEANARLIAAAPDMYEALKEALTVIDQSEHALGIERDAVDAIKRALAKADGTP